jgi:hypothetical protein
MNKRELIAAVTAALERCLPEDIKNSVPCWVQLKLTSEVEYVVLSPGLYLQYLRVISPKQNTPEAIEECRRLAEFQCPPRDNPFLMMGDLLGSHTPPGPGAVAPDAISKPPA